MKVSFSRDTEYIEVDETVYEGETVTRVIVANAGRRPVTIVTVRAIRLFPSGGYVELACKPELQFELKENQRLVAWTDDERLDLSEVESFEARDAVDNAYRKHVATWPN